jgi:hypothetical protein
MEFDVVQNIEKRGRYYGMIGQEYHMFDAKNTENIH